MANDLADSAALLERLVCQIMKETGYLITSCGLLYVTSRELTNSV